MDIAIIASREMFRDETPAKIPARERALLRSICGNPQDLFARASLLAQLENYEWREEEHRVMFQAILRLRGADSATLREHLPGTVTRMGFPDVDWKDFFPEKSSGDADLCELARHLRDP